MHVRSGNKLMKQIYPQSCSSGSLSGGLCLSSSTVWWRMNLLPLHGSKMAVIYPVGGGCFNSWRQHGHVDAASLSESQGDPPTIHKAMLSSPWLWDYSYEPSALWPRDDNTHQINYDAMVWTWLQSSACLFVYFLLLSLLSCCRQKADTFLLFMGLNKYRKVPPEDCFYILIWTLWIINDFCSWSFFFFFWIFFFFLAVETP